MEQYRGGREDTYSFDGQRHKQSKLSPRRGLTAYEWRDKMDNIRSEVAMIEKQSTKRVLHSAGKLDTVLQESFRKIKEPSEIDIRLAVNTHQHDMEELQNRQEQMNSEIDSFKVKHGIYSKGTYLGEKDKLKADKAANTVVKLVRAKYAAKLIDKKRKEWLVSLGVQRTGKNQNCESETTHKGAVEEDAVEKLATMPHIANLLYQLVEPPEPLLGWLWMSEIDEDQVSLIWYHNLKNFFVLLFFLHTAFLGDAL
uniref:Uncharacterized protein n=1 Tax=Heterosigma akashiwo TaxID=2829 RepID=A0A6V1P717_HETAK